MKEERLDKLLEIPKPWTSQLRVQEKMIKTQTKVKRLCDREHHFKILESQALPLPETQSSLR